MNEKPEILSEETPRSGKLSIGQTIRKQRVSMNVSIDKISRDLKINKIYVQAIEDDRHDLLPALPYVRGYVRGIGEYLSLDSVKLLKQLSEEDKSGSSPVSSVKDTVKQDTEKEEPLNVSMAEQKKGKNYGFPILLVVLLGVLAYFAMEFGSIGDTIEEEEYVSSEIQSLTPPAEDEEADVVEGEAAAETDGAAAPQTPSIELLVRVVRDSSSVEIISDGVLVRKDRTYANRANFTETAKDSMIVRLGAPGAVELTFNGNVVPRSGNRPTNWLFTKDEGPKTIDFQEWQRIRARATVQ